MSPHRQNHRPEPANAGRVEKIKGALLAIALGLVGALLTVDWFIQ